MTDFIHTFEGGSDGTTLTAANTGTAGDNAFNTVTGGAVWTFSTTGKINGALGGRVHITSATAWRAYDVWTANSQVAARIGFTFNTAMASVTIFSLINSAFAAAMKVGIDGTSKLIIQNFAGATLNTSAAALTAGTAYYAEIQVQHGAGTTDGTIKVQLYAASAPSTLLVNYSAVNVNAGTADFVRGQLGNNDSPTTLDLTFDDVLWRPGTLTAVGSPAFPPTAAFSHAEIGTDTSVDGTGSTAVSPATIAGYDWNWGDSTTHGTGSTSSHTYATGGIYTVVLTVTDSNALTGSVSHSVTVTTPGTQAPPTSVTNSTGLASNSGTVLNAITDKVSGNPDLTTFASGSTGSILRGAIGPISPPQSGQPLSGILAVDRASSTSGSISAKLYEKDGTTLRSTVTVAIPDMTASGGTSTQLAAYVQVAWPWVDVQSVVDWNQLIYEFTFTVS